jgi:hypothetical protein
MSQQELMLKKNMYTRRNKCLRIVLILLFISYLYLFSSGNLYACKVPVFRYALERWPAEDYQAIVVYKDSLTAEQAQTVKYLESQTKAGGGLLNLNVIRRDISLKNNDLAKRFLVKYDDKALPMIYLFYPQHIKERGLVWSGDLTLENAKALSISKKLNNIYQKIVGGSSAVWLFLESGNKDKDERAYQLLKETLQKLEKEMELPAGVVTATGELTGVDPETAANKDNVLPENMLQANVPLKISFTIESLSYKNQEEQVLLDILTKIEPDLGDLKTEPMIFPIFGQGYLLPPLIGAGINEKNIFDISSYVCGPCSCQIKVQNPVVDILMAANWEALVTGNIEEEKELPPLTGAAELIKGQDKEIAGNKSPASDVKPRDTESKIYSLTGIIIIGFAGLFLVLIIGSIMLKRDKK